MPIALLNQAIAFRLLPDELGAALVRLFAKDTDLAFLLGLGRLQLRRPRLGALFFPLEKSAVLLLGRTQALGQLSLVGRQPLGLQAYLAKLTFDLDTLFFLAFARVCLGTAGGSCLFQSRFEKRLPVAQTFAVAFQSRVRTLPFAGRVASARRAQQETGQKEGHRGDNAGGDEERKERHEVASSEGRSRPSGCGHGHETPHHRPGDGSSRSLASQCGPDRPRAFPAIDRISVHGSATRPG
jgi:hypothetical protein